MHYEPAHLYAYLDGFLQAAEYKQTKEHLSDCPTCRSTCKEIQDLNQWSKQQLDTVFGQENTGFEPASAAHFHQWRNTRQAPKAPKARWWQWLGWSLPIPAAMAIWLTLAGPVQQQAMHQMAPQTNTQANQQRNAPHKARNSRFVVKGDQPVVYMTHAHRAIKGTPKAHKTSPYQVLYPNDLIQFRYHSPKPFYLLVMSLNQQGNISVIMPEPTSDGVLQQAGRGTFPPKASFDLDESTGMEQFLIFTSHAPISQQQVRQYLRQQWKQNPQLQASPTQQAGAWNIESIVIEKRVR